MDAKSLWKIILSELEISLTRTSFKTFFGKSEPENLSEKTLTVALANAQIKNLVEKKYSQTISEICQKTLGKNLKIIFTINKNAHIVNEEIGPLFQPWEKNTEQAALKIHLRPDFTFANFAVSGSNQLAHAAAQAVSQSLGKAYNPLYLWGGVGVGKTHLIQAIGHVLLTKNPEIKIVYATSEEFTNEITMAIRNKTTDRFRQKYRNADCLLVDDIQFIAGKDSTQEEFFHTFNVVQQVGGQIILTSDKPPREIELLEDRIRSRFEQGLVVDVAPPDFELRTAILLIKAKQKNINLPMAVAQFIAEKVESARRLEGILIRLMVESQTKGVTVDVSLAASVIGEPAPVAKRTSVKDVFRLVSSFYNIKASDLKGECRKKELVWPRQILMWFLHQELGLTLDETGEQLGGRDHTTVLYGCEKINQLLNNSDRVREEITGIKQKIYE